MTTTEDLKEVGNHFAFGENWADYAGKIDQARVAAAAANLARLLGPDLDGLTFLDIGSGSGLHALAALQLGCRSLLAVDLDPRSVETTHRVLAERADPDRWRAERVSVFELDPAVHGRFDVVYSWGVLHHTGAMHDAIDRAARMVAPGGRLALALYRKTALCGAWRAEKRLYSRASPAVQGAIRRGYVALLALALACRGRTLRGHVAGYGVRGMDFDNDVHDWLGGYPYESIGPAETIAYVGARGFVLERSFVRRAGLGLFGSGCDEYVFVRSSA